MIAIIAAISKNNVIGKDGKIPWKIKGEQSQFKNLTLGHTVIMGRKSYEEIGHPLPGRKTIIVSRSKSVCGENIKIASSLTEAISIAGKDDIYIAGGSQIYNEAISVVDRMYITEIDIVVEDGDAFFPEFNKDDYDMQIIERGGENNIYTRKLYIKKQSSKATI